MLTGPASFAQLSGSYTINNAQPTGGTNFASFTAAATALIATGVNGPVTFTVSGGPYTEQLRLDALTGTSATNRVTFKGQGCTIQYGSNDAAQKAVVTLNGADYVTVDSLNVDATAAGTSTAAYGWGIQVLNSSDYCTIRNCTVTTNTSATTSSFSGIVSTASATDATTTGSTAPQYLTISNNTVTGGYYGITVSGSGDDAAPTPGIVVRGNTVKDFYFYGLFAKYLTGAQLVGNDISRPSRATLTTFYGVYLSTGVSGTTVAKNRLHRAFPPNTTLSNGVFAMYMTTGTAATAAKPNVIANNLLYDLGGGGMVYCFYNGSSNNMHYYYNTVDVTDPTSTTAGSTYGFYQSSGVGVEILNNLVQVTRSGYGSTYPIYIASPNGSTVSNYNNLAGSGTNFKTGFYNGTAYVTLANWQAANGSSYDRNSINVAPQFSAPATGNLVPSAAALNGAATPLAIISDDVTGAPRSLNAPDIGAYEFTPTALSTRPTASEEALGVFPNPSATGYLTLRLPLLNNPSRADLLDEVGRVVRQQPLNGAQEQVFLTLGVAPGFYTLRIQTGTTVLSKKVLLH